MADATEEFEEWSRERYGDAVKPILLCSLLGGAALLAAGWAAWRWLPLTPFP